MTASSTIQHWKCPNCSELIEPQFDQCWKCGTPIPEEIASKYHDPTADSENITETSHDAIVAPVAPYLEWSVLAFFLFLPFGLLALLYSVLAEISKINEKSEMVQDYSRRAGDWRLAAFRVWLILLLLGLGLVILLLCFGSLT